MIDAKTIKVTILKKMVQKCMKELLKEIQSNSIKEKPKKPRKPKKKESKKKLTDKVPKPKKEKKSKKSGVKLNPEIFEIN